MCIRDSLFIDLWYGTPNPAAIKKGSAAYLGRVKAAILARANARKAASGAGGLAQAVATRIMNTIERFKRQSLDESAEHDFRVDRFSFKFTDHELGVADQTGYTTAVPPVSGPFAPGRRQKDKIAYLPMLQISQ